MAATRAAADKQDRPTVYNNQIKQLNELRAGMQEVAMASGDWHVQTVKTISASQKLTDQIIKQKVSFAQMRTELSKLRGGGTSALGEAIKEQTALRNAMTSQMTGGLFGKQSADMFLPKNLGPELDNARVKYGMINQMIGAAATQTINWGKNTQWAGRQITVGLSVPIGMAAIGAAALALQIDQNLTRIAKVYNTVSQDQMGQEQELQAVRTQSMQTATRMAQQYGATVKDTLDTTAQLAASGLSGAKLQQATAEVTRIATLGELDHQKAIDMTISLQTAFKLSNEDLTKSFDMMNAVENATSLSIDDIATAVPRAASAFAALGGSVKDLTVMMVAMKESGVDPAVAANAIKSATSRLINPTTDAVTTFKKKFNIDLEQIVKDAKGNVFEIIKTLSKLTHGKDALEVEKGIQSLFGTFQFDRLTALWKNLGDAQSGVMNQTATAMKTVAKSSGDLANIADQEITRWQQSVQGKFKRAVEGIKAELVPFGTVVLEVFTPIIGAISSLLDWFNQMPDGIKKVLVVVAGLAAAIGPIIMLVGIMANLTGSMMKGASAIANLGIKFKAQTAEEAAAAMAAKQATSAFDSEARSAAMLTATIRELTQAMEAQALAAGNLPFTSAGLIQGTNGTQRQVKQRDNGSWMYAAGSKSDEGKSLGGQNVREEDLHVVQAMEASSKNIAADSEKTKTNYQGVGKAIGLLAGGAAIFAAMKVSSDSTLDTWINIGLTVAGIGMMFPGIFGKLADMLLNIKGIATGIFAARGGSSIMGNIGLLKNAFQTGGIKAVGSEISAIAPKFASIAGTALRVFGPIGILVGGVLVLKQINDELNKAETQQKALGGSAKSWADALGYTYSPGQLPGMTKADNNTFEQRTALVDKMTEANKGLSDALTSAAKAGKLYEASMSQAVNVLTSGGELSDARNAFAASLQIGGVNDPVKLQKLLIRFDKAQLDNPENVKKQISDQLSSAFSDSGPLLLKNGGFLSGGLGLKQLLGGELTSDARAAGEAAGQALGQGLLAAGDDLTARSGVFDSLTTQMDNKFKGLFNDLKSDPELSKIFDDLGVSTADQLAKAMSRIQAKVDKGVDLTGAEKKLHEAFYSMSHGSDLTEFENSYREMMDTIIDGLVTAGTISESQAEKIKKSIKSIGDLRVNFGAQAPDKPWHTITSLVDAAKRAVDRYAQSANTAAAAVSGITTAAQELAGVKITAQQATQFQRSAMEGTMSDIYAEADRRLQAYQNSVINGIQNAGKARADSLEAQSKAMDKNFDARQKALDAYWEQSDRQHEAGWKAAQKAEENAWDSRIKNLKAEADAVDKAYQQRIDAVQAEIDAEQNAEDQRQKIFEAEQTRIDRMAQRANSSIDFNTALNSGKLDDAAKIMNDAGAKEQSWNLQDAQNAAEEASQQRQKQLSAQVDSIQAERDARKDAYDEQISQISAAKDAALEALKERQDAEKQALDDQKKLDQERLADQRQAAQDALAAQKDANQKATDSAVASAQASFEADRASLAQRLRELQAFVPRNEAEMWQHIARIQEAYSQYGVNLSAQGSGWAQFIGNALRSNVTTATNALLTDINWEAMGQAINARIAGGTGVTASDLQFFIQNGRFPKQGAFTGLADRLVGAAQRLAGASHEGGIVRHGGGPTWSSKDRTGVPRSASLYPSEVPALLKRGEFVVNKKATAKNRELLETINSGGGPSVEPGDGRMLRGVHHLGGIARHTGGLAEVGPLISGSSGEMVGRMIEDSVTTWVITQLMNDAADAKIAAAAAGAAGYSGPMTGTIKGALDFARTQEGKPYIWGGSGPAGQDCSGFMSIIANYILGKNPPYGRIFATGSMAGGPTSVGPFRKGGGPSNAFRIGVDPNSHTAGTLGGINVESGSGHGPMVGKSALGANSGFQYQYYLPQADSIPQLYNGGTIRYDNTLANLHKRETVLTEPLSQKLKDGVDQIGDTGNTYHFTLDLRGSTVSSDVDIERAVNNVINNRESRNGRRRTI